MKISIPEIKINYRLKDYNFGLVLCALLLSSIGILLIGSANQAYQTQQMAGTAMGLLAMAVVSLIDYRMILKTGWLIYGAAIAFLLSVTVAGAISGGAARWIEIGPLRFQPSEVSKILLILFFSRFFAGSRERMGEIRFIAFCLAAIAVPVTLILEQPDLSTAVVVAWVFLCILFMAGLEYRLIGRALIAGILCGGLLLFLITRPNQSLLNDYQYRRIMAWL